MHIILKDLKYKIFQLKSIWHEIDILPGERSLSKNLKSKIWEYFEKYSRSYEHLKFVIFTTKCAPFCRAAKTVSRGLRYVTKLAQFNKHGRRYLLNMFNNIKKDNILFSKGSKSRPHLNQSNWQPFLTPSVSIIAE